MTRRAGLAIALLGGTILAALFAASFPSRVERAVSLPRPGTATVHGYEMVRAPARC